MKDGIPAIYWVFRWSWSILHLALLALLTVAFLVWCFTDHQGADAFAAWRDWTDHLRHVLSSLVPYPWS